MQVFLCVLNTLANCVGYLARFAKPEAHSAVAVADYDQSRKLKDTTAFYRFGNAVDRYYSLFQIEICCINKSQKYPSLLRI